MRILMRWFRRLRSFQTLWPTRRFAMPWKLARSRRSRRLPLKVQRQGLGSQSLEPRLALAFSSFETVASTFAPGSVAPIPAEVVEM